MKMVPQTTYMKFLLGMLAVTQHIYGGLSSAVSSDHEITARCTTDPRLGILSVDDPMQKIIINLSNNFKYIQVSMKISGCYSNEIYRGNRFLTLRDFNDSKMEQVGIPMILSLGEANGTHTYSLKINSENLDILETVDTAIKCGKCLGYRIKAAGATICAVQEPKNTYESVNFKIMGNTQDSNNFHELRNAQEPMVFQEPSVSISRSYVRNVKLSKSIDDLHRWATTAYVMAIWFTLTVYVFFLLAQACQKKMDYFLGKRTPSHVPVMSPRATLNQ